MNTSLLMPHDQTHDDTIRMMMMTMSNDGATNDDD
jgi:hypothetical protein